MNQSKVEANIIYVTGVGTEKRLQARQDLFWFCSSLVKKVARVCQSITEHSKARPKQTRITFDTQ